MGQSQNSDLGSLTYPGPNPTVQGFPCVSTITNGDLVVYDSTAYTYFPTNYVGVKTSPTTADNALVIGIAQFYTATGMTTVVGTTSAPTECLVITQGLVIKAKVNAAVVAGDSLVADAAAAGQLIKAVVNDTSALGFVALTAAGTLIDGTSAAGYASVWIRG